MKHARYIIIFIVLTIMVGCGGTAVSTNTPGPIVAPPTEDQVVEGEDYALVVNRYGEDFIQQLDEDGNVIFEVGVDVTPDVNGNFSITVTFDDGSSVTVTGHFDKDGYIDDIKFTPNDNGEFGTDLNSSNGNNLPPKKDASATPSFFDVDKTDDESCGIENDGSLFCWNNNVEEESNNLTYGDLTYIDSNVSSIESTNRNFYYVKEDGPLHFLYSDYESEGKEDSFTSLKIVMAWRNQLELLCHDSGGSGVSKCEPIEEDDKGTEGSGMIINAHGYDCLVKRRSTEEADYIFCWKTE